MTGERLRSARASAGLSQAELAERAGVSRALVSSVEQGRHLPAVDAALRLADAVGLSVEELFGPDRSASVEAPAGGRVADGTLVRAVAVGDRLVAAPVDPDDGPGEWAEADAVVDTGSLELFPRGSRDGALILGCDPALQAAAVLAGHGPNRVVGVSATTGEALKALEVGRCHAALVHGPAGQLPRAPMPVRRWHVARWQVGVGYDRSLGRASLEALLAGGIPLARRDPSAASDQALTRAAERIGVAAPVGPLARGHIDGARRAALTGGAAITYGPAAHLFDLSFEPLETHEVELWVAPEWTAHPGVARFLEVIGSRAFRSRLQAVEGYDLG